MLRDLFSNSEEKEEALSATSQEMVAVEESEEAPAVDAGSDGSKGRRRTNGTPSSGVKVRMTKEGVTYLDAREVAEQESFRRLVDSFHKLVTGQDRPKVSG